MAKHSFDEIKEIVNHMAADGWEPELILYLYSKEYMIITYQDHCSFQRCGLSKSGSGEVLFKSIDELYLTPTLDNILLSRDWNDITDFESMDIEMYLDENF